MSEKCRLIIAFFPVAAQSDPQREVERVLTGHPLRIDRIEATRRGVLVFGQSTACDSLDLMALRERLVRQGEQAGFRVRLQREDLFRAMHSLVPNHQLSH